MNPFSLALVITQFGFIALILSPVKNLFGSTLVTIIGLTIIGCSIILALWAMATLKRVNFSVLPEPVSNGKLITSGPYALIRHPMYSAVILACLGAAIGHATIINWFWILGLCVVLIIKIKREEAMLQSRYPDYETYSQNTRTIIPWVY